MALGEAEGELTLRIVGRAESQALNAQYRGKSSPTNVLSFPYEMEIEALPLLGDIVICAPLVLSEARAQGKTARAHWAHLVIHGCLHVLGYDHVQEAEAIVMETRERELLSKLGFANPYGEE